MGTKTTFTKGLQMKEPSRSSLCPSASLQTRWWHLFFTALVSMLANFRQTILCSHSAAMPTSGDLNKILCWSRTFLSHPHLLVLYHVEGNYTFIYYTSSNIKPWKLYQRQQLFNHPSRYTSFKRQSRTISCRSLLTLESSFQRLPSALDIVG